MLNPLLQLVFLSMIAIGANSNISGRDSTDPIAIDGKDVPTTTDFPAPETTNPGSSIANAYTLYIQYCGIEFQQDHDEAIAQYTSDFNSPPDDPNAPDFIAWAYTHVQLYKAGYQMCEMYESKYKDLLATFVPETLSQTSATGAPATQTSASHKDSDGGSSEDGGLSKTDGASTSVPKLTVLVLTLVAAHVLIRQ